VGRGGFWGGGEHFVLTFGCLGVGLGGFLFGWVGADFCLGWVGVFFGFQVVVGVCGLVGCGFCVFVFCVFGLGFWGFV